MNLDKYSKHVSLESKKEIDKCVYLSYFLMVKEDKAEFSIDDFLLCFYNLHFSRPNISRLKGALKSSSSLINGSKPLTYKLQSKTITRLDDELPNLKSKSEEILSDDKIIPEALFLDTRGYLESLSRQINASYEQNIFDGCAVLMRRLIEILLIHSYENHGIDSEIKDNSGNFKMLNHIVSNAKTNSILALSRNTKEAIEDYRTLGNFSAHKIFYNAKRKDINAAQKEFRASVEELLYKSGIKI
ncbi:DUF4145 domain-containing protein [Neptunomonas antarctica]|uniref:Uncharacterized protein n=1 Tax=Neptunomonas antarctica TaxID=619304 RepID=A0A1N7MY47_9GAMM|nr:DUF4145 domain-containing protein [Neptunomonas antarctica]SIS91043.1 protein of unknown function [Neptunomonas antarctica]